MSKKDRAQFKRGARFFQKIEKRLIPRFKGRIVAIEPTSGKYFMGFDELEAAKQALAAFPNKVFVFFRIGYPAVHKFRPLNIMC